MSRVRISTTVDSERLALARELLDKPDSVVIDQALQALISQLQTAHELDALIARPYDADPDLAWESPSSPSLDYDGDVPVEVVELAGQRRAGTGG